MEIRNAQYQGAKGKAALYDLYLPSKPRHLVVFAHGYKGFKDWGSFPLWSSYFTAKDIGLLAFNFSHNGIGLKSTDTIDELDCFSENCFSYELHDLNAIFKIIASNSRLNTLPVSLMAHSRGGGIAQVFASENSNISKLILMASISDFDLRFPWDKEDWKKQGVAFATNARTGQKLPHRYAFYQDYLENKERFTLSRARRKIHCPVFVAQGDSDPAVPIWEAEDIANEIDGATLKIYSDTDHVFGAKHPYLASDLPAKVEDLLADVVRFIA